MNLLEEIKNFIVAQGWERDENKLNANTRISEDLGLEGDDADDFMQAFSKKFNVDLANFNFDEYFASEGFDPFRLLAYLIGIKKYKSITLSDLERAARNKRW
jgi:hypothetical protein